MERALYFDTQVIKHTGRESLGQQGVIRRASAQSRVLPERPGSPGGLLRPFWHSPREVLPERPGSLGGRCGQKWHSPGEVLLERLGSLGGRCGQKWRSPGEVFPEPPGSPGCLRRPFWHGPQGTGRRSDQGIGGRYQRLCRRQAPGHCQGRIRPEESAGIRAVRQMPERYPERNSAGAEGGNVCVL